ncbi:hypothetical protein LQ327_20900 [Actinomycetospora endophytica]|uniref:Uncharacterized protein n=1 Tax=Actinomycetospora endophytica TaxID=2291215 RepID=A0ABS8PC27_9PSEU|nr:hypothetical protein [Actinomycetospora endophytica]MCD2195835.1 hypothetical protein [Actinomycetospora endophytica]
MSTSHDRTTDRDESVVAAVARLRAEFRHRSPANVEPVVAACRRDLDGSPPGALPELVERLARQRLLEPS